MAHDLDLAPPALPATLRLGPVHLTVSDLYRSSPSTRSARPAPARRERTTSPRSAPAARTSSCCTRRPARGPPAATRGSTTTRCCIPHATSSRARVQRLARTRTPIDGASDHGVSEAIYLPDPDGNGIELYADRAARRLAAGRPRRADRDVHARARPARAARRRGRRAGPATPRPACAWATSTCTSATSPPRARSTSTCSASRRWPGCRARCSSPPAAITTTWA